MFVKKALWSLRRSADLPTGIRKESPVLFLFKSNRLVSNSGTLISYMVEINSTWFVMYVRTNQNLCHEYG
ncbi:hypothetical protein CLF_100843 [Clonorchis sinensis]|uniref:Uncharacterized protein n=1 Tax=Clonorchis sinensis TaxID=79923 RepID=G7Y4D6_CLOSI|nr:hypothetical protein CLF_100843 [Clonorchis sinensis]